MEFEDLIAVADLCKGHNISDALILELREFGLVEIIERRETRYIHLTELPKVERILRLHTDLEINWEGIEVINQLLERIENMQNEVIRLQNRLSKYE